MTTLEVYHKHLTQKVPSDPHWRVNCSAYCLAMAVNDATLGGIVGVTGRVVRALSNEPDPDPDSPGLNLKQLVQVARKLRVSLYDKTGQSFEAMLAAVGSGSVPSSRAIVQVAYRELGDYRAQAGGDFGHAMVVVLRSSGLLRCSDPLASITREYPASVIEGAAVTFARESGLGAGIRYAITRQVPLRKV